MSQGRWFDRPIPPALRKGILAYLVIGALAIGLLVLGGIPMAGILLVILGLPWSLLVVSFAAEIGSAGTNVALLAAGVGVNSALLYLAGVAMTPGSDSRKPRR